MFFTSDCSQVRKLLWELASGTVTGSVYEHAEAHLARCEACRSELDSYQNTISLMTGYKRDAVPVSRLGWRDIERRVASQESGARGWTKPLMMRLAMGGGSLALATVFVMFVMQVNMNPRGVHTPLSITQPNGNDSPTDLVSAPEPVDFHAMAGMLAFTEMPPIDDAAIAPLRPAPPHVGYRLVVRSGSAPSNARGPSSALLVAANEMNVDGGSPVQPLRPDYVLASASSGNDDDQNRRYIIDVVAASGPSSASDGSEESHPW